jgi:hypothetical protein
MSYTAGSTAQSRLCVPAKLGAPLRSGPGVRPARASSCDFDDPHSDATGIIAVFGRLRGEARFDVGLTTGMVQAPG